MRTVNLIFKGDTVILAEPWVLNGIGVDCDLNEHNNFMKIVNPDWVDPPCNSLAYQAWDEKFNIDYNFIFPVGTKFLIGKIEESGFTYLKTTLFGKKLQLHLPTSFLDGMVIES